MKLKKNLSLIERMNLHVDLEEKMKAAFQENI